MSSKLTPAKFPIKFLIAWIYYYGVFFGLIHTGTTYTPPKCLNKHDFPYMTGNPAFGPIFPNPKIAVPSVTIAHKFFDLEYGFSYKAIFFKF